MREELRKRLPRIQHFGVIVPGAIIVAVGAIVLAVWVVWFRNTPERAVRAFMEAYRTNDVAKLAELGYESPPPPLQTAQKQVQIVSDLLAKKGRIVDSKVSSNEALVYVEATFTGSRGQTQPVTAEVRATRKGARWLVDMEHAADQMPAMFWGEMQAMGEL